MQLPKYRASAPCLVDVSIQTKCLAHQERFLQPPHDDMRGELGLGGFPERARRSESVDVFYLDRPLMRPISMTKVRANNQPL